MKKQTLPKSSSERLPVGLLLVDKAYQRLAKRSQVNKIVKDFNPEAFQALLIGRRENGKLYVVDGQQRLLAAKKLKMENVLCSVFNSDGRAHEANIFKRVNNDRTGVGSLVVYRACMWAGDKETLAIEAIIRECGFKVPVTNNRTWPNITATSSLYAIYRRRNGAKLLTDTLMTVRKSWPKDIYATKGFCLSGVAQFLSKFELEIDHDRLIKLLSRESISKLLSGTEEAVKLMGGARHAVFARGIMRIYNKRLQHKLIWGD